MAAAADLSPEQRTAMIRGMVERLAERLHRDGSDLEGWLRLVRSYMVLGERDKARAAAGEARRALASEPDKLRQIDELVEGARARRLNAARTTLMTRKQRRLVLIGSALARAGARGRRWC